MQKVITLVSLLLFLTSCNYYLLVKRNRVLQHEIGFMVFNYYGFNVFLPTKNKVFSENYFDDFKNENLKVGIRYVFRKDNPFIFTSRYAQKIPLDKEIKMSPRGIFILPMEIEYVRTADLYYGRPVIEGETIEAGGRNINIRYKTIQFNGVSIKPYLSPAKIDSLDKEWAKKGLPDPAPPWEAW